MKIAPAVTAIQSLKASPLAGAENHVNVRNAKTTNNAVTDETLLPAAYDVAIEGISDSGRGQRELYYLGIIDILQKYNVRKHLETDLNILTRGLRHYKECSCPVYHQMSTAIGFLSSCVVSFDVSHNQRDNNQRDTQWSLRWHDVSCIAPAHISQGSLLEFSRGLESAPYT